MSTKQSILLFLLSVFMLFGGSLAQRDPIGGLFDGSISGAGGDVFLGVDENIFFLDVFPLLSDRQTMTGEDNDEILASGLDFSGFDLILLSGENDEIVGSGSFTGEIDSGSLLPSSGEIIFDPIYRLILSEVYYDGTDEWVEITNSGEGDFYGDIMLSGVKSTPLSLTNISLLSGESKLFGDTLIQFSGSSFVEKTGLGLSMTDTAPIRIYLSVSGQNQDDFIVDQYRVKKYNDKKTSFEKVGEIVTRVQSERVSTSQTGYSSNPGIYFATGSITDDVGYSPEYSGTYLHPPLSCDLVDQRDLIKINEIFPGNEKYPPYIELLVYDTFAIDTVSISGDLLGTGVTFSFDSGGTTLEKNTLLLLAATGFWQNEHIYSVRNDDFYLLSTGNWLLITIGSGQNRRVMDIVYLSGNMIGRSSYFGSKSQECIRIMDVLDDFSPGFEQRFLKYLPVTTVTKIEYVSVGTGNQSPSPSCPSSGQNSLETGNIAPLADSGSLVQEYTLRILAVDYDPEGSDTNNEKITLLASHISGNQVPLDLAKTFRLKVNGTNKTLPRILPMDTPTTFTKTFGFPNSTTSGQEVVIQLTYGEYVLDTYTYTPKKLSSQDVLALTTTGYTVTSVLDGDSFRIKYQGKTQSVRLLGIDAPESTKTRYKHLECFGLEAKNYLKTLIDKKKITFQFDPTQDQKDIYDRLLAYVFLDDKHINQTMIEDGYAKEYTYKTSYTYQSQFIQAEQSAQQQGVGLWSESTCGVSLSGVILTGDNQSTGDVVNISGLQFMITYVLPNPKGSDNAEELGLRINYGTSGQGLGEGGEVDSGRNTGRRNEEGRVGSEESEIDSGRILSSKLGTRTGRRNETETNEGTGSRDQEIGTSTEYLGPSTTPHGPVTQLDLSQGFSLRIGTTKKKIQGIVDIGQENIVSGSLGLVNKAACVSLLYEEQELTKFCYGQVKEGQKIYASYQGLAETPKENLDILNVLQLKRIGNQLCIWYKEQSFLCKRIPASKAEIKATQEQKLYKGFASLVKQYIINNWKGLYYGTQLKQYFDLVAENKKLIGKGLSYVDIYGQSIVITDMKEQLKVMERTLPGIVALFIGKQGLGE